MALCLRLPLQLPLISKYPYLQCSWYLTWSNLRGSKKNGETKFFSSQGSTIKETSSPTGSPNLADRKLEKMFKNLGHKICGPYLDLLTDLAQDIPTPPARWQFKPGWTWYSAYGPVQVKFPDEDALVLDVEVCVREGFYPTLAAAVSRKAWYLWVSPRLVNATAKVEQLPFSTNDLFSLGKSPTPRIIVGHFISYDRVRIKEQYDILENSEMRFFDTLAAHVCVSGVTNPQRHLLFSSSYPSDKWRKLTSPNSLEHVVKFYCGETIDKAKRDTFVNGSLSDIARDFQLLCNYCVEDVIATHKVFRKLLPLFLARHPHPVTLVGMLQLSTPFLPVSRNWEQCLADSKIKAEQLREEQFALMTKRANDCLKLAEGDQYKLDPWLWDLNWKLERLYTKIIPSWYKAFCVGCWNSLSKSDASGVYSGLSIPKIFRLRSGPFPLHYIPQLGWGVIVPEHMFIGAVTGYLVDELPIVPVKSIEKVCEEAADCYKDVPSLSSLQKMMEMDLYWRESSYTASVSEEVGVSESQAVKSIHELLLSDRTVFRKLLNAGGPRPVRNPLGVTMANSLTSFNSMNVEGTRFLEIRDQLLPWLTYGSQWAEQQVVWNNKAQTDVVLPMVRVCSDYLRMPHDRSFTPLFTLQSNTFVRNLLMNIQAPETHNLVSVGFAKLDLWFASLYSDRLNGTQGSTKFSSYFLAGVLFEELASESTISIAEAECFSHAVVAGADTYMLSKLICQCRVNISRAEAFQLACKVMDVLVDYGLLSASPEDLWPGLNKEKLCTPLLGCRISRPLELEKKRVRLRAQWLIHSSKADFLHLFMAYYHLLEPQSKLCFVYGDTNCLYFVPRGIRCYEAMREAHQAVESFCLSRFGLPPHCSKPSSTLIIRSVSRGLRFDELNDLSK